MPALLQEPLEKYIHQHTSDEGLLLQQLERKTFTDVLMPQMLSGKVQGRFLSMLSRLMQPRRILEIGSYTGYSALCLAEGLTPDGYLITIDINEELEDILISFINDSGNINKIKSLFGNASDIIPKLNETFDMVFIDADKQRYSLYYDLVIDKVRSGGLILADNVLWSGRVCGENPDKDTQAIMAFNDKITQDERVDNVLLSIRDGIMMIYKK
jgi:predicted O-methyltransferase YrrM